MTEICRHGRVVKLSTWIRPENDKILIIGPAMGVKRFYYKHLAEFMVVHGFNVLSMDYFGMIHSEENKGRHFRLEHWGEKDIAAVIEYASDRFPFSELFFLGHSVAGQLLALAPNSDKLKAAVLIASQAVSSIHWRGINRWRVELLWNVIIPVTVKVYGYLPGWAYGGKHPLHADIARQWASWARHPKGLTGMVRGAEEKYKKLNIPVCFLSFHDDLLLAPVKAVEELAKSIGSLEKDHVHLGPVELHKDEIGHFNYFREEFAYLWPHLIHWFEKHSAQTRFERSGGRKGENSLK